MAGAETPQHLGVADIIHLIEQAGRRPVERDTLYNVVAETPPGAHGKPFRRAIAPEAGGALP
jgi:hypothetical protein